MDEKLFIEHMIKGIYQEIDRANEMKKFTDQGKKWWGFEGDIPNKARFKRHRLMLEEHLREVEKQISIN